MPSDDTLLVLSGMGIPDYSARGLTQTLEPIDQARNNLFRDVNGKLIDLTPPQFKKYRSTISCDDVAAAALDGIWPGMQLTVDCVQELAYPATSGAMPQRTPVYNSEHTEGDFIYYRPQLLMTVMDFTTKEDEWGRVVGWQIDLEEDET